MKNLSTEFYAMLNTIGMKSLKHPIFDNAPIGIRFEIGEPDNVYLKNTKSVNPVYISDALNRAKEIYLNLPCCPDILRIDTYPNDDNIMQQVTFDILMEMGLPSPHEQRIEPFSWDDDCDEITQRQFYWDLSQISFSPDILLEEIIKADLGGIYGLTSSVYFVDTINAILFHVYDDRGADLIAANKEALHPIFERLNSWILGYDREKINKIFL